MAGYGHSSVTGLDERSLGRIDLLLFDADYPDVDTALQDAWNIAVLASDPRLRDGHDRTRAEAVRTVNARRDPSAARVYGASARHRVALAVAMVLAAVAAGLVLTLTGKLTLQDSLLPAGAAATLSAAMLWWLEPRRANGSLWGSRVPSVLHLVCGALWLLAASVALLVRWGEIDANHALPVTTGLALLTLAGVAALVLWRRARAADLAGRQSGIARVTGDLVDQRDAGEVFAALDAWWQSAGPAALRADAARIRRVRVEVLARLRLARTITDLNERFVLDDPPPTRWSERRR